MLSQLQLRIERSLFEAIRKVLVLEGYIPDINDTLTYGTEPYSEVNQATWNTALSNIVSTKGFAVEAFNHSVTKGIKKVPRIAIIPRRTLPGDIGAPNQPYYINSPTDPKNIVKRTLPFESSHFYMDIHIISGAAKQDRVLNAVLSKALGTKKFIPYYDELPEKFFVRQYNYYDIPDPIEGQEEKVYGYEIPDLFDVADEYESVPLISEITAELVALGPTSKFSEGQIIGPYINDGNMVIDLSGINFN